jgi:hypothetical protein
MSAEDVNKILQPLLIAAALTAVCFAAASFLLWRDGRRAKAESQIEAIFHGIDVRHGMAWKPAWSEGIAVFPIASYVGAIGPSLVVMLVLRLTRWTSDARKIIGIFALTCVLALLATYVEAAIVRDPSATLSNVIFVTGLVCLPGISIPALYCLIAGVPWRRPQAG